MPLRVPSVVAHCALQLLGACFAGASITALFFGVLHHCTSVYRVCLQFHGVHELTCSFILPLFCLSVAMPTRYYVAALQLAEWATYEPSVERLEGDVGHKATTVRLVVARHPLFYITNVIIVMTMLSLLG